MDLCNTRETADIKWACSFMRAEPAFNCRSSASTCIIIIMHLVTKTQLGERTPVSSIFRINNLQFPRKHARKLPTHHISTTCTHHVCLCSFSMHACIPRCLYILRLTTTYFRLTGTNAFCFRVHYSENPGSPI